VIPLIMSLGACFAHRNPRNPLTGKTTQFAQSFPNSCRAPALTQSRRPRSTWGRATRPLWTEEELALYVAARRRKSARIDPGFPSESLGPGLGAK
jgi:hypothetical protein